MKISLEKLYQKSAERPPGYLAEVLTAGAIKDGYLEITWPDYQRLRAKYCSVGPAARTSPPNPPLRGAGDLVAKFAKPIARAIDRVVGTNLEKCDRCKNRRAKLNAAIPFK